MDTPCGAVEPQYMKKSASGGDPYSCLFQRILVLPNRPAPAGFRQHEVDAYWPTENTSSKRISKKRRASKSKKKIKNNATTTTVRKNNLVEEIQSWRKERDERKAAASTTTMVKQDKHSKTKATNIKRTSSEVTDGDKNHKRRPTPTAQTKKTTHRVPSRRVGKPLGKNNNTELCPKPSSITTPATANPPTPTATVLSAAASSSRTMSEIALNKLQAEAKAAQTTTSTSPQTYTRPIKPPPPPSHHVPVSPRAAKAAGKLAAAKLKRANTKTNIPPSMLPTIRAKVNTCAAKVNDLLEQHEQKHMSVPPSGAAQAAHVLDEIAQSVQGAIMIRDNPGMIVNMSRVVDIFVQVPSPKNEIVAPCLMALGSLCRRFAQMAEKNNNNSSSSSSSGGRSNGPQTNAEAPVYSMVGCKRLLELSIRCVVYLHDIVSKQTSNEALESGLPRLAASAHLLKGLAEYCTYKSNPPTPHELESRDLFVTGGGATILLALSQSKLKTSSRPARVALANFTNEDFSLLASPSFELQSGCQLKSDPLALNITTIASAALEVEMNKRNKQQRRSISASKKQKEQEKKNNPKLLLEERQQKLAQWLGSRGEQNAVDRESWKERDRQQKALLATKLESDKARYAKEKLDRAEQAETYRQNMLLKFTQQKALKMQREEASKAAEEAAERQKTEANQAKVESWLKKKRDTMRGERGKQLQNNRTTYRKNMKDLNRRKQQKFGNTNLAGTAGAGPSTDKGLIVPGSGFLAKRIGGSKLAKSKGGQHQHLYGGPAQSKVEDKAVLSFGITGHNFM
jgi:hypothetical protein